MNQTLQVSPHSLVRCLVSWVGISALLMSPALAQVNGPGPSPANSFDIVLDLPDDLEVISGGDFESVGGALGQTTQLNVDHDGTLGNDFEARLGSEVNVSDGTVGSLFRALSGSEMNISGGTVGSLLQALSGSQVNISGGNVGDSFESSAGSEVNISGGNVGDGFSALGAVSISGGTVGDLLQAFSGCELNISGGTLGDGFSARSGSQINIIGREFFIDGQQLDTLAQGEAFTITDRNVTLSGLLANGEPFSFQLNSAFSPSDGFFSQGATLTVTLDSSVSLGDVNRDGAVNFLDITPFIAILSAGGFQAEADIDQNGEVNFLDISPFIGILSSN